MATLLDKILQRLKEEREKEKQRQEQECKAYESFMPKAQNKSSDNSHGAIATIKAGKAAQDKAQKEERDLYSKYIPRPQKAVMREEVREINNTVKRENAYKNIQNSDLFESWTKKAKALGLSGQSAFDWASEQYNKDPIKQTLAKRTNTFELAHPDIESKYKDKPDLVKYAMYAGEKIKEGFDKNRQEQKKAEEEDNDYIGLQKPKNVYEKIIFELEITARVLLNHWKNILQGDKTWINQFLLEDEENEAEPVNDIVIKILEPYFNKRNIK